LFINPCNRFINLSSSQLASFSGQTIVTLRLLSTLNKREREREREGKRDRERIRNKKKLKKFE